MSKPTKALLGAKILFWVFVAVVFVLFTTTMSDKANASEKFEGVGGLQEHAMYDLFEPLHPDDQVRFNTVGQWCNYTAVATYEIYEHEAVMFNPESGMIEMGVILDEFSFNVMATYEHCSGNSKEHPPGNFNELVKELPVKPFFNSETDVADHWVRPVDEVVGTNPKLIAKCVGDLNVTTGFFVAPDENGVDTLMEEILYLHVASRDCTLVEPVEKDPLDIPTQEI